MSETVQYSSNNGRDIYASTSCRECGARRNFAGYADAYFFDVVNKAPMEFPCECGSEFRVQWFGDGTVNIGQANPQKKDQ